MEMNPLAASQPVISVSYDTDALNLQKPHPIRVSQRGLYHQTAKERRTYPNHASWTCRNRERKSGSDRGQQAHYTKSNGEDLDCGIMPSQLLLVTQGCLGGFVSWFPFDE